MSRWPRGYTCERSRTAAKELVQLQRPPPDTSTLASTFFDFSKMVTSQEGFISFRLIARKNPAAPPPIIAVFILLLPLYTNSCIYGDDAMLVGQERVDVHLLDLCGETE